MSIKIIAAVSINGVIGNSSLGKLPWVCPEEMAFFREQTINKVVVFGRKTAEEVGALKGRVCIVITSKVGYELEGFETLTLEKFLALNEKSFKTEYFVCGGASLYKATMPYASLAVISYLDFEAYGDIMMPELDRNSWRKMGQIDKSRFTAVQFVNSNRTVYSKILSNKSLNNKKG